MEKSFTLNKWLSSMENELTSSNLFNFDLSSKNQVRIMEEDFISLFNSIISGDVFDVVNLSKSSESESYDINQYRKSEEYTGKQLFTNLDLVKQQEVLKNIFTSSNESKKHSSSTHTYLCFGLLKYKLNPLSSFTLEAPLVLIPVDITFNEETNTYSIIGSKNEVLLNLPLVNKMLKERKLDISYPVKSDFSISNYLYYIGVKVKPLNWHVQNHIYLTNINLSSYYNIESIKKNSNKIQEKTFFKKVIYPNSEFYSFSSRPTNLLDSKFLSILEMENEEHIILKKIVNREEMVISTPNQESQSHLVSNIILSYLLNDQKALVVYSNEHQKNQLKASIEEQGFTKYCVDLNPLHINKKDLLLDILNYDKYQVHFKSTKTTIVNENLNKYYGYKNDFKKLLNSLRTNKNHINSSINKVVNEYYRLSKYPLIEIKDANKYSKDSLSTFLTRINLLSDSIENLNCKLKDHPFYGLNKKQMHKADYIPLKSSAIALSTYIDDATTLFKYAEEKYQLPIPYTLKEFKALLNILSFANDYPYLKEWIDIKDLDSIYDILVEVLKEINELNAIHRKLIDKYTRKVGFLDEELISDCFNPSIEKKSIKKVKKLLGNNISSSNLTYIINSLQDYYIRVNAAKEKVKNIPFSLTEFMHKNKLKELREIINSINFYKNSLRYIKGNENFNIHDHLNHKEHDRLMLRRSLQTIFNNILEHQNVLQDYFDNELVDFSTLPFDEFNNKVKLMSKEFIKINDYTSFFIALHKVNELIPDLGNKLIESDKNDAYEKIFLRRFYHDFLMSTFNSNPLFKNYSKETIYGQLRNFSSTNIKRKEMISDILDNYINNYLRKNMVALRNDEAKPMALILKEGTRVLPLETITKTVKNSLFNLKPCTLIPYEYVGQLLDDDTYSYDVIIYMSDDKMTFNNSLSSIYKGKTTIVIDNNFVSSNPIENLQSNSNLYSFINNAKHAFTPITLNLENKIPPLNGNFYDVPVKEYISNQLMKFGFESRVDRTINGKTIDILARVPNTKSSVAIMIDHLSYNSPEAAFSNIESENKEIKALGYEPYRIFPSTYFFNEKKEQQELNDFIIKVSKLIPEPKVKKNKILLMDHLFTQFIDPHLVYYQIDKENNDITSIIKEMINKCSPISLDELELIVKENTREIVKKLAAKKEIIIENNFIYLPKQQIKFRRVNRNENYYRPIEYVSSKELFDAIYQVVNYSNNIQRDTLIKMILLSLGYKKINEILYSFVDNAITILLNKKVIFIDEDNVLYKDLEN